ncbi:hypothetical protein BKA64DRAFT_741500 [Cadophora sp. MPI-SDFR-AT-0126]|nr:hypothetical protein BKA64DRAFT_741500 [Leotiomycetes sp. MPI-SDFR-AT-0126]
MLGDNGRSGSESVSDHNESTDRMTDETRSPSQPLPPNVEEPLGWNSSASKRMPATGNADLGTSSPNSGASRLDEHTGKEQAVSESLSSNGRKRLDLKVLSKQLSNGQKSSAKHSNYVSPNVLSRSELGLPYTVASSFARRQLEANNLPPSSRTMLEQNTELNHGPEYISPSQLYEMREGINGRGRGMFASCNIKKGQLIMFEHPLITLYFYKNVIKWSHEIVNAIDGVAKTSGDATNEASRNLKITRAFARKANRHYENDVSFEVTEAPRHNASDAQTTKTVTELPKLSLSEDFDYKEDDDTQTVVRKRLKADFNELCKFNSTEADALKRLQNDPENHFGGDWLLLLWQRFSREIPGPGSLNTELSQLDLGLKVMSDGQTAPAQCRSLYQDICYINHSCHPNAQLVHRYDAGTCYGWLLATADILRNDEITLFYEKADRIKRRGISGMNLDMENAFDFECDCEPCLAGYSDRRTREARD